MIGLLHQRLLNTGVADPPTYNGASATHSRTGFGAGPIEAGIRAIFRPDGTWATETILSNPRLSGNWYQPTTDAIGAGYEVKFTVTQTLGSGTGVTITNPAAAFTSLAALKTLTIKVEQTTTGGRLDTFDVLVEIRLAGGAVVATGTIPVELVAELNI